MAEHLSVGEFERFSDRLFKQLDAIEAKQDFTNGRVTALEVEQKVMKKLSARISAAIAFVISLVGLAIAWIKG